MRIFYTFILVTLALLLSGCDTFVKTKEVIVYKNKNILVTVPDELIVNCEAELPPSKQDYMNVSTISEREQLQTDLNTKQYAVIAKCNNTISSIRNWKQQQLQIFKDKKE